MPPKICKCTIPVIDDRVKSPIYISLLGAGSKVACRNCKGLIEKYYRINELPPKLRVRVEDFWANFNPDEM